MMHNCVLTGKLSVNFTVVSTIPNHTSQALKIIVNVARDVL